MRDRTGIAVPTIMTSNEIHLVWYGRLKPCPRPKIGRGFGVYYPSHYTQHLKLLKAWFNEETMGVVLPENALYKVRVVVYKKDELFSRRFGDVDNLLKTVLDCLPFDDVQVVKASLEKRHCLDKTEERFELSLRWNDA